MKPVLISNNPLVWHSYPDCIQVHGTVREVLLKAREGIHKGQRLLTHPLTGSLKPNQTPYKSVLLAEESGSNPVDLTSLQLIEKSLAVVDKLGPVKVHLTEGMQEDYQVIDLSFVESAWESLKPLGPEHG